MGKVIQSEQSLPGWVTVTTLSRILRVMIEAITWGLFCNGTLKRVIWPGTHQQASPYPTPTSFTALNLASAYPTNRESLFARTSIHPKSVKLS